MTTAVVRVVLVGWLAVVAYDLVVGIEAAAQWIVATGWMATVVLAAGTGQRIRFGQVDQMASATVLSFVCFVSFGMLTDLNILESTKGLAHPWRMLATAMESIIASVGAAAAVCIPLAVMFRRRRWAACVACCVGLAIVNGDLIWDAQKPWTKLLLIAEIPMQFFALWVLSGFADARLYRPGPPTARAVTA